MQLESNIVNMLESPDSKAEAKVLYILNFQKSVD
jgi:hypothetical protein